MHEQRRQILDMLAEGTISADEAERLITAMEGVADHEPVPLTKEARRKPLRYLRVLVESPEGFDGKGTGKVNVRVPLQLLRSGVRLAGLLPPQALSRADAELQKAGVPISLAQLKPEHLEDLIEQLDDMTIDVDQVDAKVRVFFE